VIGYSESFHGAVGVAFVPDRYGVFGINSRGIGVAGQSEKSAGVVGQSKSADGIFGISRATDFFAGIAGLSTKGGVGAAGVSVRGIGVTAQVLDPTPDSIGLYAKAPRAAEFDGNVLVRGDLVVDAPYSLIVSSGNKSGLVRFDDDSDRLVFAMESPEAWFEDFGEASLVKGKAHIALGRDFAQAIDARHYHVFLAPYGETAGLYASRRTRRGFDVTEQKGGKSNVRFSWRVVARPKSIKPRRFPKSLSENIRRDYRVFGA
jgi:hypothetical protein